jgi:hypothetical protein
MSDGQGATPAKKPKINPVLKFALELGPLALFFLAYSKGNIYIATGVLMAACWRRSRFHTACFDASRSCRWSRR